MTHKTKLSLAGLVLVGLTASGCRNSSTVGGRGSPGWAGSGSGGGAPVAQGWDRGGSSMARNGSGGAVQPGRPISGGAPMAGMSGGSPGFPSSSGGMSGLPSPQVQNIPGPSGGASGLGQPGSLTPMPSSPGFPSAGAQPGLSGGSPPLGAADFPPATSGGGSRTTTQSIPLPSGPEGTQPITVDSPPAAPGAPLRVQ